MQFLNHFFHLWPECTVSHESMLLFRFKSSEWGD